MTRTLKSRRRPGDLSRPGSTPNIPGYSALVEIGRGSTATVYRARQDDFRRTVALKVLHVDVDDRKARRRFTRELERNGTLSNHPNVVTILDAGFAEHRVPFLAMDLYEHGSLAGWLAQRGPLAVEHALRLTIRVAGALESAHRAGILHGDVKPQNVLLSTFGEPALADFGLAGIAGTLERRSVAVAPVHTAPEVLEGDEATPRSDVFALASTLYTLLAGSAPFAGPPGEGLLAQLLRVTSIDLPSMARGDVPPDLVDALRRATSRSPEQRTASAAAFGRSLQDVQARLGHAATALPVEELDELTDPGRGEDRADRPALAGAPLPSTHAPVAAEAPDDVFAAPPDTSTAVSAPAPRMPPAQPAPLARPVTVEVDDAPTVTARQLYPTKPEPPSRTRRRLAIAATALLALGAGAAVAAFVTERMTRVHAGISLTDGAEGPTVDAQEVRPANVEVSTDSGSVVVTFTDRGDGKLNHLVYAYVPLGDPIIEVVAIGTSVHVVAGIGPGEPACLVVAAVIELGTDSVPAREARSRPPVCINGAEATPG